MPASQRQENPDKPVVIVGGGIAGLACAVALGDANIPVHLFEGAEEFGGRAQSLVDDVTGDHVDIGPHVLTSEHRNMLALLERLGTAHNVCWQPERFITLVDGGKAVPMRNFRMPAPLHFLPNFFHVQKLSVRDTWSARRVLWRVMQMSEHDVLAMDDRVAEDVLREMGVTERFIDWFWRTVCMAVMNVPLEECSAASLFRFLKMMSGHNDFHFGFPMCALADLYVPGALRAIDDAGGVVSRGTAVKGIDTADAVRGVVLENGETLRAEQCVLAIPPAALAHLVIDRWPKPVPDLDVFRPSPYVSTYLWFSRKLTDERFWARIWSPDNFNYDFYDLSNIRPGAGPGSLIATNMIYSERINAMDDATLVSETLRELAEFLPLARTEYLVHARVHRISMAISAPHPGFEQHRPGTRTEVSGLYLAGDWVQTSVPESMESAVRAGFLAAEAVAADRGITMARATSLSPLQGFAGWMQRHAQRRRAV